MLKILEILAIGYVGNTRKIDSERHEINYTLIPLSMTQLKKELNLCLKIKFSESVADCVCKFSVLP